MSNMIEDAINKLENEAKTSLEYLGSLGLDGDIYDTQLALLIELIMSKIKIVNDQSQDERVEWNELKHPTLSFLTEKRQELISRLEKDEECTDYKKILANSIGISPDSLPMYSNNSSDQLRLTNERLTFDELLKLELYDFFDYCRHGDGVPDLYILKYLEKYSDGFKPELVKLIWRDFWPYFEAEKEEFYGDSDRIQQAIERWRGLGRELPLHPDVEYTPPQRKEGKTDEQYDKICEMAKRFHDSQRGTLDVKKLLSTDSLELWHLFKIESLLKQKMGVPVIEDDITPTGQRNSNKPCPISRDAVGFLFRELRNKGVIKPISDTDLSESIEGLTGYSKEKIRQNNSMSDKAKEDLRGLLLSIADQLK